MVAVSAFYQGVCIVFVAFWCAHPILLQRNKVAGKDEGKPLKLAS
jgi:hypothetical protein